MSDETKRSVGPARREFMRQALVALPCTQLIGACAVAAAPESEDTAEVAAQAEELARAAECSERVQRRRDRWRRLLDLHMGHENKHDLQGVMSTFSEQGQMIFNRQPFTTPEQIAGGHILFGMSDMTGGLANTQVVPERHYYTDDELLIEGKLIADHVGTIGAFPATQRRVELHYAAFYRFDAQGELVSERIVMNWAPLAVPA
jgi:hypothetical protein